MLSLLQLFILVTIFLITSMISVVTGSNSLITVPAMIQMRIDARTALATNTIGLIFMSMRPACLFLNTKQSIFSVYLYFYQKR